MMIGELSLDGSLQPIRGAYDALPRHRRYLRPRHIEVHFLPLVLPTSDITYQQLSDKVKQAIAAVL